MGKRLWPFREMENVYEFTPLELFQMYTGIQVFIYGYGDRILELSSLAQFTFPFFLKEFRKILKREGYKDTAKIINDWKHLLGFIYSNVLNIYTMERLEERIPELKQQRYMFGTIQTKKYNRKR